MKRRDEILVGALLVGSVILGVGGTLWIARGGLAKSYVMFAKFPWGAGLKQGAPLLLAGVNVGFVKDVDLVPDEGTLLVTLSVRSEYKIPSGSTATVEANGIFGDQLIALYPIKGFKTYMPANDTIPAGVSKAGFNALISKGDSIAGDVRGMTSKFRNEFVDGGGIAEMHQTVKDLTKLVGQLAKVADVQSQELTRTQEQLRKTLSSIDSAKVDSTVVNFRAASANLEKLTRSFDSTRLEVNALITKASSGNGTMGRLMNDPALFNRMEALVARLDSLTLDIKNNPRKYINLKIF
jgi:phospholipid/cholesterol/gamma-HCH transport system substrate-binding protein